MAYTLYSHDTWGRASIGSYASLAQAQEVFEAARTDRWFNEDGSIRQLSIVEDSADGGRTVATHDFQRGG